MAYPAPEPARMEVNGMLKDGLFFDMTTRNPLAASEPLRRLNIRPKEDGSPQRDFTYFDPLYQSYIGSRPDLDALFYQVGEIANKHLEGKIRRDGNLVTWRVLADGGAILAPDTH